MPVLWGFLTWVAARVLVVVRWVLDSWLIMRGVDVWWGWGEVAQDGVPVPEGVAKETVRYGDGWREVAVIMRGERGGGGRVIVYTHGGGWGAANAETLSHSMTPFVREGYTVVAVNYPLAPTHPFPHAPRAVLKALSYLKTHHGFNTVHLHGDSAGGNLATFTAAIAANPHLSEKVLSTPPLPLPKIASVTSLYGILDENSFTHPVPGVSTIESQLCAFLYSVSLSVYKGGHPNVTISSLLSETQVTHLPPSLLVSGSRDPLAHSSTHVHWALKSRGFESHLHMVQGARHAFFGLPSNWFGGLLPAQQPTLRKILLFMEREERKVCVL